MRPYKKQVHELLDRSLGPFRRLPEGEAEAAGNRVLESLRCERDWQSASIPTASAPAFRWSAVAVVAVAILTAVLVPVQALRSAPGVLEDGSGIRKIQFGEVVSPRGAEGATLKLHDGSRVEMRSDSEVSLEKTEAGVRLRVRSGDVIVNASEQLVVETKDVSAAGKVFLVNAKAEGSRVTSIGGEVHVQQGSSQRRLRVGEHITTDPRMALLRVGLETGWTHEAETHLAALQQSVVAQKPPEPKLAFHLASIRPSSGAVALPGARGGGAVPANGCGSGAIQVDPSRVYINKVTLQWLISVAYSPWSVPRGRCNGVGDANVLVGGPSWVRAEPWDIEALIPEGGPYTLELTSGKGSDVQRMLQALLADRFKLVLRTENKEMPVYFLTVTKDGPKFNGPVLDANGKPREFVHNEPDGTLTRTPGMPKGTMRVSPVGRNTDDPYDLWWGNVSMLDLAASMFGGAGRPVLDRTGLTGEFEFHFEAKGKGNSRPPLSKALEDVGLKLEDGKAPVEIWTIEHAERPTEN